MFVYVDLISICVARSYQGVQHSSRIHLRILTALTLLLLMHASLDSKLHTHTSTRVQQLTRTQSESEVRLQFKLLTKRGHCYPVRLAIRERSETHRSLHGAPGRLKAFFDRTAERGITLPNEQAQSRGISLCSGCIVAASACLAQPVCFLWGPGAQCLHSYSQNIF